MTDLAELKRLAEAATSGPWEKRSYQSGTVCVVMREWIGPKTKEYGHGFLAAHMTAYNIDFQDEHLIDAEKNATASFIAAANPAAILSLIERVEKAEAELLEMQKDEASLLLIAHLDGADRGRKAGRAEALEEAAKWHEAEIERLEDQIEHNNEYARRSGNFDGEANDFCRSLISNHRSGAAAIRALGEKAG